MENRSRHAPLPDDGETPRRLQGCLSTVLQHLPHVVFYETGGGREYISENIVQMLGYTAEELIRDRTLFSRLMHPDDRERAEQRVRAWREEGGPDVLTNQFRIQRVDGEYIWLEDHMVYVRPPDEPPHMAGVMLDITEKRRLEEEVLRANKMEAIGVLAGGIAHDFNNFLTVILGNIVLAKRDIPPGTPLYQRLTTAERACRRAEELTFQLLTFSQGGAPVKSSTSLQDLLHDTADFATRGAKTRCVCDIPQDLFAVQADPGQISQVVQNLVLNATQAMPDGGIITIRAENVTIREPTSLPLKPGNYVRVTIADQGVGIQPEHLPHIFDPYFSTKPSGCGLGLATVYWIIQRYEGHIEVQSEPGVGTTFLFYLPAAREKPAAATSQHRPMQYGKGRILVMDDDAAVREIMAESLRLLGYEAVLTPDGVETLALYMESLEKGEPFDAVIMDLTIPGGMGGAETVQHLRAITPDVPVILASGYANATVTADHRAYGFSAALTKPFTAVELGRTLYEVLQAKSEEGRETM